MKNNYWLLVPAMMLEKAAQIITPAGRQEFGV